MYSDFLHLGPCLGMIRIERSLKEPFKERYIQFACPCSSGSDYWSDYYRKEIKQECHSTRRLAHAAEDHRRALVVGW